MKTLVDQLSQYAAYHRDPRNLATHVVGVPMIVVAVTTLLSRPQVDIVGLPWSPAIIVALAAAVFYLRLDARFGATMALLLAASVAFGQWAAGLSAAPWLAWGAGLFVVGWIIQFVGHHFEGRKPAFVDDVVGLLIGPLFVVAELAFAIGARPEVRAAVEERVGPMRVRPRGAAA